MKRLIICKLCHETLEDPIILPCGKTICSKHLLNEANIFKCGLCDNSHDKTVDKLLVNEKANEFVQICDDNVDLNSIDLGKEYNLAKEQCKILNDLIKESELLIKDPEFYIDNYFSKLKNEIDLSKEQLIESIEQKYEQLINEIKEIEIKCKQNAQNKEPNNILVQTIKVTKPRLSVWIEKFKTNFSCKNCCESITNESGLSIGALKNKMNNCQVALLENKEYKFNSFSTKDSVFGDLVTNDAEIIDESRLEVSFIQILTGHRTGVLSLTVLQNGNLVSGSTDETIKIWNPTAGTLIQTLTGHRNYIKALTVLQDGNLVSGSTDGIIKIWNPTTGSLIRTILGNIYSVDSLTVLQKGNLASGSFDRKIKIWNPTTGALIQSLNGHSLGILSLTVLQNGNLVSGSYDKTIKIWNSTTGALIQNLIGHTDVVSALTVLQNGNLVSCPFDKTIKIWNPTTGALIQTLTGHTGVVRALAVLQNGNLVSTSDDRKIKIWVKLDQ